MTFIEEIATYLQTNGIGTLATDLFISYMPNIDSCVCVLDTGGMPPDADLPTKEPTFQIFVRASSYEAGRLKLDAIRALLHRQSNLQLNTSYAFYILALAEGGHIGLNETGKDEFSMNFKALIR